jgi:hypothetical protein
LVLGRKLTDFPTSTYTVTKAHLDSPSSDGSSLGTLLVSSAVADKPQSQVLVTSHGALAIDEIALVLRAMASPNPSSKEMEFDSAEWASSAPVQRDNFWADLFETTLADL